MRSVDELRATADPAWPGLEQELRSNPQITILPVDPAAGRDCLFRLQVTTRSRLGALALHTGGLLVDDGWLRILGGGHNDGDGGGLPSLAGANGLPHDQLPPAALLVGYDVLGGRFEINGPDPAGIGRPGSAGEVCYFGPDTLEWQCLDAGHGAWLSWIASGATSQFYESLRWPHWQTETRPLPISHGLSIYPFLWSREAQQNLAGTSRRPAPMTELFALQDEFAARFAADPDATTWHVRLTE